MIEIRRIRFTGESLENASDAAELFERVFVPGQGRPERRNDDPAGDSGRFKADFERLEA